MATKNETIVEENTDVAAPVTLAKEESQGVVRINVKENQRKRLASFYTEEKKVPVTISPFYAPYLGRVVPVLVNGIRVDIPADGRTYQINETHAGEIITKIRRIDALIARQKKAGDVSNNFESNIGEIQI